MDPLTAISLASAIVQFVDFTTKIVDAAGEICNSASGATLQNQNIEFVVSQLKDLCLRLDPQPRTAEPTAEEQALYRVATECRGLSEQILAALEQLKPKDPKSKFQRFWSAVKSVGKDKGIKELLQRLLNCRGQLELQLSSLLRSDTKARLENLAQCADEDSNSLKVLQGHVDKLRQGVNVVSVSPEFKESLREFLGIAGDGAKRRNILQALEFSDMYGRFETVEPAHSETFKWIFDEDYGDSEEGRRAYREPADGFSGEVERERSIREPFLHWLSCGDGIFHISGKLGSGKSTLMKFLCDHERTETELQRWAGQRKLVFAKFFFWKPGTQLQKSLGGLFRCLLHDALRSCPELIPKVFPDTWDRLPISFSMPEPLQLSNNQIRDAFHRLIQNPRLYEEHRFCFFIDGLDEYEETRQEDYKAMVDMLCGWTQVAPGDVKICVSSREYNVFLNNLSSGKRLRLQDLTKGDMKRYILNKLGPIDKKVASALVDTLLSRARGIFLWVGLVVKSLRERMEETLDLSILQEEINALPEELEDLFRHLLDGLSRVARVKAYKTFALLEARDSIHNEGRTIRHKTPDLTIFAYSFLEDYSKEPEFAIQIPLRYSLITDEVKKQRIDRAEKSLRGNTKCLLEAVDGKVTHIHRSIKEFLQGKKIQDEMTDHLRNFNAADALSQLYVVELRVESYMSGNFNRRDWSWRLTSIILLRTTSRLDCEPYTFLESLEPVLIEHGGTDVLVPPNYRCMTCSISSDIHSSVIIYSKGHKERLISSPRFSVVSPLHISAYCGSEEYVVWKIRRDNNILNINFEIEILLSIIIRRILFYKSSGLPPLTQVLHCLLEKGLSPQAVMDAPSNMRTTSLAKESGWTVWGSFIFEAAYYLDRVNGDSLGRKFLGTAIEKFLEHGADPSLWFSRGLRHLNNHNGVVFPDLEMTLGSTGGKVVAASAASESQLESVAAIFTKVGGVSLRELVEYWKFENMEKILKLIDKNTKQQKAQRLQRALPGAQGQECIQ